MTRSWGLVAVFSLVGACNPSAPKEPPASVAPSLSAGIGAEVALPSSVLDSAMSAFRDEAGRFVGGRATHRIEVGTDGSFTFAPSQLPKQAVRRRGAHGQRTGVIKGAPLSLRTTVIGRGAEAPAGGTTRIA